jgi:sugar lactone lactonase YvrE
MFVDMSPGSSDGIRCDVNGNVWSAAGWGPENYNGVHVFALDGTLIGKSNFPEALRQSLFRWCEEEPFVHGRESVPLRSVRGN